MIALRSYPPSSQLRPYCTSPQHPHSSEVASKEPRLTHISSETGKPTMVSITDKSSTSRSATAIGRVVLTEQLYNMLSASSKTGEKNLASKKGDVLLVAQLAGIMGSKKTSDLIPLCHPLNLSNVQVGLELKRRQEDGENVCFVEVSCTAECQGSTGVEMEALTGVSVACLTIWDMCKAVAGKEMVIEEIKVVRKSGGKSGDWERPA